MPASGGKRPGACITARCSDDQPGRPASLLGHKTFSVASVLPGITPAHPSIAQQAQHSTAQRAHLASGS
jgi:hypothetical protein